MLLKTTKVMFIIFIQVLGLGCKGGGGVEENPQSDAPVGGGLKVSSKWLHFGGVNVRCHN